MSGEQPNRIAEMVVRHWTDKEASVSFHGGPDATFDQFVALFMLYVAKTMFNLGEGEAAADLNGYLKSLVAVVAQGLSSSTRARVLMDDSSLVSKRSDAEPQFTCVAHLLAIPEGGLSITTDYLGDMSLAPYYSMISVSFAAQSLLDALEPDDGRVMYMTLQLANMTNTFAGDPANWAHHPQSIIDVVQAADDAALKALG
ncbi:MAG: hypothetical protein AB2L09_12745 [Coriobacteriia bacterium]